jgi:hypothetical protein
MKNDAHETIDHDTEPRAEVDQLAEATLAAVRAPSVLNTQPWHWKLTDGAAELWLDRSRQLSNIDPDGRLLTVSCGVALHHAVTALHAGGFAGEVHRFADPAQPDLVARVRRGARRAPESSTYRAIYERHTDRRPFADEPPSAEDLDTLRRTAEHHGVHLQVLRPGQVPDLAVAVAHAGVIEQLETKVAADIATWTNRPWTTHDGVSVRGLAPGGPRTIQPRDFTGGRKPGLPYGPGTDLGTVYAILSTDGDEPRDWLAAGEALSDVWLTLTARGLAASPISEVVEMTATRELLKGVLGGIGYPAIALRIGVPVEAGIEVPRTVRRSGEDVIDLP